MKKSLKNKIIFKIIFVILDLLLLSISMLSSLILCQSFGSFKNYLPVLLYYGLCLNLISVITYQALGLYSSLWKYASIGEGIRIIVATFIIFILNISVCAITHLLPITWSIIHAMVSLGFLVITRFAPRLLRHYKFLNLKLSKSSQDERVLIVGAGDAGEILIKEMQQNPELK